MRDILDSNSDTRNFELSQFGMWFFVAGLGDFLESVDNICMIETLELELDRVEQWDREHGGFYTDENYDHLRAQIASAREQIEQFDREWYAELAREEFRVIDGGKA